METRAREIGKLIDTDETVDIAALNIELSGIREARENLETRSSAAAMLNVITGMSTEPKEKRPSVTTCWIHRNTAVHL